MFVDLMGGVFPELTKNADRIKEVTAEEEIAFGRTLQKVSGYCGPQFAVAVI